MNQQPHIIGGRDGVKGRTWLAISEYGHLALVTEFRELNLNHEGAIRKGETMFGENRQLVTDEPIEFEK